MQFESLYVRRDFTCLWSVRGWTLMCCSVTRGFCHCGVSGSEGHSEKRDIAKSLCGSRRDANKAKSGRHDNIEDSCAPATRRHDGHLQSSWYCWRVGWQIILHYCRQGTGDAGLGVKHYRCPEVLFQSSASTHHQCWRQTLSSRGQ